MKITWFGASSPTVIQTLASIDIPRIVYTFTQIPPWIPYTAKGVILGVEVGYGIASATPQQVQCNIEYVSGSGPYWTDIARPTANWNPAANVGAVMQQVFVPFDSLPAQQFRYWLVSTDPTIANKQLIIMLHGYWE